MKCNVARPGVNGAKPDRGIRSKGVQRVPPMTAIRVMRVSIPMGLVGRATNGKKTGHSGPGR